MCACPREPNAAEDLRPRLLPPATSSPQDWASALEEDPQNRSLPLYGLPVSIKENFEVEGMDTTLGLAKYLYQPAPRHAALVQVLRLQGAVPFCKTNVPQSLVRSVALLP